MKKITLLLALLSVCGVALASFDFQGSGNNDYAQQGTLDFTLEASSNGWTFAAWYNADADHTGTVVSLADFSALEYFTCTVNGGVGGNPISFKWDTPSDSAGRVDTSSGFGTGSWEHMACVTNSDSDHDVYIDGGSVGSDTSTSLTVTYANLDRLAVGARRVNGGTAEGFNGKIAYVTIWDKALSSAQISSLAGGTCPTDIENGSIVAHYPMQTDESPITDEVGTNDLNIVGTVAYSSDDPSVSCGAASNGGAPFHLRGMQVIQP